MIPPSLNQREILAACTSMRPPWVPFVVNSSIFNSSFEMKAMRVLISSVWLGDFCLRSPTCLIHRGLPRSLPRRTFCFWMTWMATWQSLQRCSDSKLFSLMQVGFSLITFASYAFLTTTQTEVTGIRRHLGINSMPCGSDGKRTVPSVAKCQVLCCAMLQEVLWLERLER